MKDPRQFVAFWVVNSALLFFAPFVLVGMVESGNVRLSSLLASVISGFILAVADALVMPVFDWFKIKIKDEWQWAFVFLFINVLGIWVIARYADLTGIGVSNGWIALLLGAVINLAQWGTWKFMDTKSS